MSGFFALVMNRGARRISGLRPKGVGGIKAVLTLNTGLAHGLLKEGLTLPIVILEGGQIYKLTEARVTKQQLLTTEVAYYLKAGSNLSPAFDIEMLSGPLIDCKEAREIANYLDYEAIGSLFIGSRFKN